MYFKKIKVMKIRSLIPLFAILFCSNAIVLRAQEIVNKKDNIVALTPNWNGERFEDGRPKVSDEILNRIKSVRLEVAWSVLRNNGYKNQFSGEWEMIHSNRPMVDC